jgi:RNA polymerase sigma-70 factor, ECF subfamily
MNPTARRNRNVSETLAEAMPPPAASAAKAGEPFEALYRRTFPRVYAYVASLLRDRAAAEDVTAQAFERAYRKRRSFRASRGTPEAWLFGIARNAALDELRRRKRHAALTAEPAGDPGEHHPGDDALRRQAVRDALASLDPRERDLVALKFFGGLSNAELARVLGTSESNAGTRLHRTIEKLRKACHDDA